MRRLVVPVLAALALAGCAQAPTPTPAPPPAGIGSAPTDPVSAPPEAPVAPKLSPHGKELLLAAERSGAKTVVLTISTERDKADEVAAGLQRLGATVEATDTAIGYVRASVPVELAEQVSAVEGISRVDVDEPLSYGDPTP